ncbi:hypothetical protein PENANT_c015G10781 [Penicillium antarcticum]|uniref:Uncharacterized protein n=1 Tax=Penicillium antarcticum TaxID=416450 RepID=A0A1V6Q4D3_9EURO|nr:uncharacterized protein N7508_004992 [Penicillium antarcticum]KAJ5305977.1 hypothetical protein N7508_004992 [Penicillium antarcticum]OQD83877.1 hypothetical protein PENANT_c015G10781 [Penicillium antarcticum]
MSNARRGLPLGYLNQLEQRLAETESALYGALTALRSMGSSAVQASAKTDTAPKHKTARMEEWSQLPLREWPDMERWMTVMSDQFNMEQPREMIPETSRGGYAIPMTPIHDETRSLGVSDEPHSGTVRSPWQPGDSRISIGSPYDTHQPRPGMMASPAYYRQVAVDLEVLPSPSARSSRHEVDDASVSVMDHSKAAAGVEPRSTRAEELSHENPSLYF